ncbi:hypothetical protein KFY46_26185, partial [Salmonella enterica subsp. enterica serovar 1,4,[5],12:i:-]|nr:hypothetical protein [Salmonella enterica subsp. enterica serovar 1,4,[5],12:i:-]
VRGCSFLALLSLANLSFSDPGSWFLLIYECRILAVLISLVLTTMSLFFFAIFCLCLCFNEIGFCRIL